MQVMRQARRVGVDIPVFITTVLDSFEASIVDLSEQGAQITGHSVPEGQRFRIDYRGQALFAICRWSEVDRMGVKFLYPLTEGPLFDRLTVAKAAQIYDENGAHLGAMPTHQPPAATAARIFARARPASGFGRRG